MNETLALDPILPVPQVILLAVLAIAGAAWLYLKRPGRAASRPSGPARILACLRVLGIGVIVFMLLNPVLTRAHRDSGKPPLLILFDTSHSMAVKDVGAHSRFEAARGALLDTEGLLANLREHYDCRLYGVSATAAASDPAALAKTRPDGERTQLGEVIPAAINASAADSGGVLMISDGRNNGEADPVEAARQAKLRRFPVFTVCVGTKTQGRDVGVVNRRPQVYAAPDQPIPIGIEVHSAGYDGETAMVELTRDGHQEQARPVVLNDHRAAGVSFVVQQPAEGTFRYNIAVRPMQGEATATNNRAAVILQVLKSRARVLVLEGRPTWDTKFFIQALHSDPSIDTDAIFKLTETKYFAVSGGAESMSETPGTVKIPKTAADLAKYDVVVIGKGYEEFFDAQGAAALKAYASDHAGNILFLRGEAEERTRTLEALEPIQWSDDEVDDLRLKVTEEGKQNPAFNFSANPDPQMVVQTLPSLISATKVDGEKALSVVLARADGVVSASGNKEMALLAYQQYGQGRVVSLVGQGLWRWALLPPEMKGYEKCYNDFWVQLVRWLVNQSDFLPGQDLSLKTDRSAYEPGGRVNIIAFSRGRQKLALPPVTVTDPMGHGSQVMLTHGGGQGPDYTGAYRPAKPGEYLASLARPGGSPLVVAFSVFPSNEEDLVTAADPDLMRQIAAAGGGEMLASADLPSLPMKLKEARTAAIAKVESRSAWDRGWVLALILLVFGTEWALRRRWGMA
jgi:hypothetical protein